MYIRQDVARKILDERVIQYLFICLERIEEKEHPADFTGNKVAAVGDRFDYSLFFEYRVCLEDGVSADVIIFAHLIHRRQPIVDVQPFLGYSIVDRVD